MRDRHCLRDIEAACKRMWNSYQEAFSTEEDVVTEQFDLQHSESCLNTHTPTHTDVHTFLLMFELVKCLLGNLMFG